MIPESIGTRQCRPFRERLLNKYFNFSRTLESVYMKTARRYSYVQANLALLKADERLTRHDLNLTMSDDELRRWCKRMADKVQSMLGTLQVEVVEAQARKILDRYSIPFPDENVDLFGIDSALRRCACENWWRRKVRVMQARECDEIARNWRLVHDRGQAYCSHHAVALRRSQKIRNRRILNNIKAVNDVGDEYTLSELSDLAVSNPKVRRSELMVRMRGFEDLANEQGRVGEFYTITCPSKYHSTNKGGIPNGKYQGFKVNESNAYLVGLWSRLRAALHRRGIEPYGFRVAEPNHDGCPHWHFLLFFKPDEVVDSRDLFSKYALAEDGDEAGAGEHRFKAVAIDPEFGSATGYIAKYISKNIDGFGIDDDLLGNPAKDAAVRIEAWAATHGIRQFQQIGGPSVTVWRELRRLDSSEDGIIEEARLAADSSNWMAFCQLMGSGRDQPIGLGRWQEFCEETGEILGPVFNRYGEPAAQRVFGLVAEGAAVLTRFYRWSLKRLDIARKPVTSRSIPGFDLAQVPEHLQGVSGSRGSLLWPVIRRGFAFSLTWGGGSIVPLGALPNMRANGPPLEFCQ